MKKYFYLLLLFFCGILQLNADVYKKISQVSDLKDGDKVVIFYYLYEEALSAKQCGAGYEAISLEDYLFHNDRFIDPPSNCCWAVSNLSVSSTSFNATFSNGSTYLLNEASQTISHQTSWSGVRMNMEFDYSLRYDYDLSAFVAFYKKGTSSKNIGIYRRTDEQVAVVNYDGCSEGVPSKTSEKVVAGLKIPLPDAKANDDTKYFLGWSTVCGDASAIVGEAKDSFLIEQGVSSITLYAIFSPKINITLSGNYLGTVSSPNSKDSVRIIFPMAQGASFTPNPPLAYDPRKYTCIGWSEDPNASTATYPINNRISNVQEDKTFYAIWQTRIAAIFETGSIGITSPNVINPRYSSYTTLDGTFPTCIVLKSKFRFLGWSDTENGTVKWQPGDRYHITKQTTYYAIYEYTGSEPFNYPSQCFDFTDFDAPSTSRKIGDFTWASASNGAGVDVVEWDYVESRSKSSLEKHFEVNTDTRENDIYLRSNLLEIPEGEEQSVRIGDYESGALVEQINYTFEVNVDPAKQDALLLFKYAIVFENPGHSIRENPKLTVEIKDQAGNTISPNCGSFTFTVGENTEDWADWKYNGYKGKYKDWTTVGIDLESYKGQTITLTITNYDCSLSAHLAYSYYTLSCQTRTITTVSCDPTAENVTLRAPLGFYYTWYKASDPNTVLNPNNPKQRSLVVSYAEGDLYQCKLSSDIEGNCATYLTAKVDRYIPFSDFEEIYSTKTSCGDTFIFKNNSYTARDIEGKEKSDFDGYIEYHWEYKMKDENGIYQPLEEHIRYDLENDTIFLQPGAYEMTLWSYMSDECSSADRADKWYTVITVTDTTYFYDTIPSTSTPATFTSKPYYEHFKNTLSNASTVENIMAQNQYKEEKVYKSKICQEIDTLFVILKLEIERDAFSDSILYDTLCFSGTEKYLWEPVPGKVHNLDETGTYLDTLKYATNNSKDSIRFVLYLTVHPELEPQIKDATICQDSIYKWKINGNTEDITSPSSTTKKRNFFYAGSDNCDSITYQLNLTVREKTNKDTSAIVCDNTFTWHDKTYTKSGVYYDTAWWEDCRCPKVCHKLSLTLEPQVETKNDTTSICMGQPYTWKSYRERTDLDLYRSADYYDTLKYTNSKCDSILYHLRLNVQETTPEVLYDSICRNDMPYKLEIEGRDPEYLNQLRSDSTHIRFIPYSVEPNSGCDSVKYIVHLHVYDVEKVVKYDTIRYGAFYKWYTSSTTEYEILTQDHSDDTYYDTAKYTVGTDHCDSVHYTLHLHVTMPENSTPTVDTICFGKTYYWKKEPLPTQEIKQTEREKDYKDTAKYVGTDLDSTYYYLHLVVLKTDTVITKDTICQGGTYYWYTHDKNNPTKLTQEATDRTYKQTVPYVFGCDSVVYILNLHVNKFTTNETTDTVCASGTYFWTTKDAKKPIAIDPTSAYETHYDTLFYPNGCDSIVYILHLYNFNSIRRDIYDTACYNEPYYWVTKDASKSIEIVQQVSDDIYYDTAWHAGTDHCDSVHYFLHLHVNVPTTRTTDTFVCQGDSYEWKTYRTQTITPTEQYMRCRDTLHASIKNCDSIYYILDLHVIDGVDKNRVDTICVQDPYEWHTYRTQTLTEPGTYQDTAFNSKTGCPDTYYNLTLVMHDTTDRQIREDSACYADLPYRWQAHPTLPVHELSSTGIYLDTLRYKTSGCDSIYYQLNFKVHHATDSTFEHTIAYGSVFTWEVDNNDYNQTGSYTHALKNVNGCDSLCTLQLTVLPDSVRFFDTTTLCPCENIMKWHGSEITKIGDYRYAIQNILNIDSLVYYLHVLEGDTTNSFNGDSVCYKDLPYRWNGKLYAETQIIRHILPKANRYGCDSICYFHLFATDEPRVQIIDTLLCLNTTMNWSPKHPNITWKGEYKDTLLNILNCDSVYRTLVVDTIDCCIHLKNLTFHAPHTCADDTLIAFAFTYTAGKPQNITIDFEELAKPYGFHAKQDTFAYEHIRNSIATYLLEMPKANPPYRYQLPYNYEVFLTISDTCGSKYQYAFVDSLYIYYPSGIISQHWQDALALYNAKNNGGFTFSSYQWYKDETPIINANGDHYYWPNGFAVGGLYKVLVTRTSDNYTTFTCPITIEKRDDPAIMDEILADITPTLVTPENPNVQIVSNVDGKYYLYDFVGKLISKGHFDNGATSIQVPKIIGPYLVYLVPTKGKHITHVVLVE